MSFIFSCPSCGKSVQAEEEWRGLKTQCPYCEENIVIPSNGESMSAEDGNESFINKQHQHIRQQEIQLEYKRQEHPVPGTQFTPYLNGYDYNHEREKSGGNKGIVFFLMGIIIVLLSVIVVLLAKSSRSQISQGEDSTKNVQVQQMSSYNKTEASETSYNNVPIDTKISIEVSVSKKYSYGEFWKYNCEYKLYADDQCIASKNSTSMSVRFSVKVNKGAKLRAEMLPKNGFGGIAETLEGPSWPDKDIFAEREGQFISIEL